MSNPLLETDGLPKFSAIEPQHVQPALKAVLADNRRQLADILERAASQTPAFETSILALEAMRRRLHQAWSPVSHLHAVANSPELREAYNACLPELARYETELAQNEQLFELYRAVDAGLAEDRSDGAASVLALAIRDFRLGGVGLDDASKQRFKAIMQELTELQARFEQNVLDSMAAWSLIETNEETLAGLPTSVREQAAANAAEAGVEGWLFKLDQPTYMGVLTHADNRDLRMRLYKAWATRASDQAPGGEAFDNTANIERILSLRHEAAGLIGYENFADYSLATKMAESVEEVLEFLNDLADRARPAAERELEELERFAGKALAAWDIAYYSERLRRERYAISDEELRPYFPVDRVMAGLFELVQKIYGIGIAESPGADAWHDDVRCFSVSDADGRPMAGFFVDLYARAGKRSGAWMDECVLPAIDDSAHAVPVAHLVCNFPAPTASQPSLLTHEDVLTLFHEFGHALHHMLTRVRYPSVAGINGVPWDAVELPSQFMENYAWEPEVIAMISGHHETGEALPAAHLDRLQASRVFQAGMQMVRQLEFALFDLQLHADYRPGAGSRMMPLLEKIRQRVAVIRHPEFNRFPHAFSHVFGGGYAAGYYSYKWAEVLAADAWSAFASGPPLDTRPAARFRDKILEVGGTVDIGEAFRRFRGQEPSIDPLLTQSGIEATSA